MSGSGRKRWQRGEPTKDFNDEWTATPVKKARTESNAQALIEKAKEMRRHRLDQAKLREYEIKRARISKDDFYKHAGEYWATNDGHALQFRRRPSRRRSRKKVRSTRKKKKNKK